WLIDATSIAPGVFGVQARADSVASPWVNRGQGVWAVRLPGAMLDGEGDVTRDDALHDESRHQFDNRKEEPTMYSIVVQERFCPNCGVRRTVRWAGSSTLFCFNCHTQWNEPPAASHLAAQPPLADPAGDSELRGPNAYRAVIIGGIQAEWAHDH